MFKIVLDAIQHVTEVTLLVVLALGVHKHGYILYIYTFSVILTHPQTFTVFLKLNVIFSL